MYDNTILNKFNDAVKNIRISFKSTNFNSLILTKNVLMNIKDLDKV